MAFEQITQISVLSHYIALAAQRCRSLGMPIALCMTTTGDGFYVWNQEEDLAADIALYNVTLLALGYTYAARKHAETESVPRLRCGIHFGSHYEYYRSGGAQSEASSYIVGDVTVNLARLLSQARSHQLLIGSHVRELGPADAQWREDLGISEIDTPGFVALAQSRMDKFIGLPIPGGKIASIRSYLTGPRVSDDAFSIRQYHVMDKHGLEHACYNAQFNVTTTKNNTVTFGLLDKELERFKARTDASEDIVIRFR